MTIIACPHRSIPARLSHDRLAFFEAHANARPPIEHDPFARIYGPKLGHRLPISRNDRRFAGNRIFDQCREMSLASKTPTDFIRLV
jgi:hypothetical protein